MSSTAHGLQQRFVLPYASMWGIDRWLLPLLGTPWWPGRLTHAEAPVVDEAQQPVAPRRAA